MTHATEFQPTEVKSVWPAILAAVLGTVILGGAGVMAAIFTSSGRVSYELTGGVLVVDPGSTLDGTKRVPLASIRERRAVALHGARRVRGTYMPGLCSGKWSYDDLGEVWVAGDCSPRAIVLVTGQNEPIVVTPRDPAAFLEALDAGRDARFELPAAADPVLLRVVPGVAIVLMLGMGGMLVATFLVAPKRLRYRVKDGELVIESLFSSARFPAKALHAKRHEPAQVRRVMGTAFPGYYTGRFRADGLSVRMFATDLHGGVLVEAPDDVRVYVSPAEPDVFLAALKREGASLA